MSSTLRSRVTVGDGERHPQPDAGCHQFGHAAPELVGGRETAMWLNCSSYSKVQRPPNTRTAASIRACVLHSVSVTTRAHEPGRAGHRTSCRERCISPAPRRRALGSPSGHHPQPHLIGQPHPRMHIGSNVTANCLPHSSNGLALGHGDGTAGPRPGRRAALDHFIARRVEYCLSAGPGSFVLDPVQFPCRGPRPRCRGSGSVHGYGRRCCLPGADVRQAIGHR
ncbi:hypothetical protein GA0115254_124012 [Streptomyces sp. Ncost-T10-10d]|nr:hypothetical protein GA0115254_124012 [Streptomyces sp. Ncost-T10-10d]